MHRMPPSPTVFDKGQDTSLSTENHSQSGASEQRYIDKGLATDTLDRFFDGCHHTQNSSMDFEEEIPGWSW